MKTKIPLSLAMLLAVAAITPATAAGATDPEHQRLAELAGLWNVKQSLWLDARKPAQVDAGTAVFSMVLDGRQLQQDLRVASGTPFQGIGYTGYDTTARAYFTSWMDVNLSGILVLRGAYDAGARTYRLRGEMSGEDGQQIPTREELRVIDANHFVTRYFETRNGREALVVELDYSRP
jgi:hypothetical protein